MKNTILDFEAMLESVRKDGRIHNYRIDELEVYTDYLHYKRRYIEHKYHEAVEYHLFPRENVGIYKLYQYKNSTFNPSEIYHYYVDMVSVVQHQKTWNVKDLYIDFIIKKDGKYYVVDIDEFQDAINRRELNSYDVDRALNGLDNILKGYYAAFDMDSYIERLRSKYGKPENILFRKTSGI